MAKCIQIDTLALLDAMTRSPELSATLDVETGEVDMRPVGFGAYEEDDESISGEEIPRVESRKEYALMAEFTREVDEDDIRDELEIALDGRGAFGRFRHVLARYPEPSERWRRKREEWLIGEAREWLETLDVQAVLRPTRVDPPPPPGRAERRAPPIGLVELLLLGAPEGKTELLESKVYRRVRAASAGEARAIFKNVARELCEFHGTAWRNRFIEGRDDFTSEGFELRVDGMDVELAVPVSLELWRRFES